MNKNEIYIKSGTNYKEMTKELLAQCGLASVISDKKMQIGIKPNLVSPSEASWGLPHIRKLWRELLNICRKTDMEILQFWKAPGWEIRPPKHTEVCGYCELTEKYQVPFWDMQKDKGIERDCRG